MNREQVYIEAGIPPITLENLKSYSDKHIQPGHFLVAVLSGDLYTAFRRADNDNARAMKEIVMWIVNYAPGGSYGNAENVNDWLLG